MNSDINKSQSKLTVQIPSYIHQIATTSDRGLKLTLLTQELPPDVQTELFGLKDILGWMVFATARIEPEDLVKLPPIKKDFKDKKTPAERLHAVLYVYWTQSGSKGDFEEFYRDYIEQIINHIKEKINP